MERKKITITILGFGKIGRVLVSNLVNESEYRLSINVIDSNEDTVGAYVDLCHASKVNGLHALYFNDSTLMEVSDYIFHCAGEEVVAGGTRLELAEENTKITNELLSNHQLKSTANIIVITNPVDLITLCSWKFSGLKSQNVVGVGTYLDSIRMNHYVQEELTDYSLNVSSVFLGEHGLSAVFSDSLSTINNKPFHVYMSDSQIKKCIDKAILAASLIKETQKATIYGVAACALDIFKKMESNSEAVLPLTTVLSELNQERFLCGEISMSVPCSIVKCGVLQHEKIKLSEAEILNLVKSAAIIEEAKSEQKVW